LAAACEKIIAKGKLPFCGSSCGQNKLIFEFNDEEEKLCKLMQILQEKISHDNYANNYSI
jgi:Fe-S-cluster-containing dehydrogenase component